MAMQGGPWGAAPQAAPAAAAPPPPPQEIQWHLAENGQSRGPFGQSALAAMVQSGEITRSTQMWTAGQDGWKPAGEIAALDPLFARIPPPPPPG